jgi:ADP-ribose pyrophosphatase
MITALLPQPLVRTCLNRYLNIRPGDWQLNWPASEIQTFDFILAHGDFMANEKPEVLLEARRFQVLRLNRSTPAGKVHTYDVIKHPGSVVILPMVAADKVCLIRNYRIAVGETLWELPAGTLEHGEDPLECARRELTEETGYRAGKLEKMCDFFVSPGILHERMHLFLATDLQAGASALESGEEIQTQVVSLNDTLRMIESGEIHDAKSLIGLLLYDRRRRTN